MPFELLALTWFCAFGPLLELPAFPYASATENGWEKDYSPAPLDSVHCTK